MPETTQGVAICLLRSGASASRRIGRLIRRDGRSGLYLTLPLYPASPVIFLWISGRRFSKLGHIACSETPIATVAKLKRATLRIHFSSGIALVLCFSLTACGYHVNEDVVPLVRADAPYSLTATDAAEMPQNWWRSFADPHLDRLVNAGLGGNFTLRQGMARIKQAGALKAQAGSLLFPALDGSLSSSSTWTDDGGHDKRNTLDLILSWEIDAWNRLSSAEKAAALDFEASRSGLQETALLLSSQIAQTYFELIEQRLQLALLERQITASKAFLELILLRFANGAASIVDIYQQRQQLSAIHTQIPVAESRLRTLGNRLQVLVGTVPAGDAVISVAADLPALPKLPALGIPADLLLNRPDLRRVRQELVAADYRVAEAVADRLPRLRLAGRGGFDAMDPGSDDLFLSLLGEAVAPILDWGKRKSEVERRRSVVEERLALYSQTYLIAIEEVENALWQEKEQARLIALLNEQLNVARANLGESRNRYMQGLTDYLPVLTALQSLQNLERNILISRRQMITARILLYRALGGGDVLLNSGISSQNAADGS